MNANTSLVELTAAEQKLAGRVDTAITNRLTVSGPAGGLGFHTAAEAMEFAKLMAISHVAIPKHLRGNPGACLAVTIQAIEWRLSPYSVANKSYSVNDRLAYEFQLIQAVILQRAPIKGRFKVEYIGEDDKRVCKVSATLIDGETVEYQSPEFGKIQPKNSPLWKSDPDQQQFYYAGRALCRRHFPDVLLGVYDRDEIEDEPRDPAQARDVTPAPRSLSERLDALAKIAPAETQADEPDTDHDPDTGEVKEAVTNDASNAEKSNGDKEREVVTSAGGEPNRLSNSPESKTRSATTPRQLEDTSAAGGTDDFGDPDPRRIQPSPITPTTPEGYAAAVKVYIAEADDADWLETRWREERHLRQRLGVPVADANVLGGLVLAKAKELRSNSR